MSIIYEALKKIEAKENSRPPARTRKINFAAAALPAVIIVVLISGGLYLKKIFPSGKERQKEKMEKPSLNKMITLPPAGKNTADADIETPPTYILEGIIYDKKDPLAIINGKILRKKDKIDNWEVVNISPESVKIHKLGENTILTLIL